MCKGEWLFFLGCDDVFHNEFVLEKINKSMRSTVLPVIYGNVQIKGNTGWAKDGEIYAGKFSKNRMLVKSICHQAIFYQKKFVISNNLTFNLQYPVSADWHFNLCCRRLTKFKYVNVVIAIFSAGGISTTRRDSFPDSIKIEFADLLPSKLEIYVKESVKKIIRFFK